MMKRPYPDAMREICQRLSFETMPDEWEGTHLQPHRMDEILALYWEYRDEPNEWFRDLLGKLVLETTDAAVFDGKADAAYLAKVRRFFEAVAAEQQDNLRIWIQVWRSEDDERSRLLWPLFAGLLREST